jgi:hypothetical protein
MMLVVEEIQFYIPKARKFPKVLIKFTAPMKGATKKDNFKKIFNFNLGAPILNT